MKSTGIVRKVDELGRVVIPIELRRTLSIGEKDALEIFVEADTITCPTSESRSNKPYDTLSWLPSVSILQNTIRPSASRL